MNIDYLWVLFNKLVLEIDANYDHGICDSKYPYRDIELDHWRFSTCNKFVKPNSKKIAYVYSKNIYAQLNYTFKEGTETIIIDGYFYNLKGAYIPKSVKTLIFSGNSLVDMNDLPQWVTSLGLSYYQPLNGPLPPNIVNLYMPFGFKADIEITTNARIKTGYNSSTSHNVLTLCVPKSLLNIMFGMQYKGVIFKHNTNIKKMFLSATCVTPSKEACSTYSTYSTIKIAKIKQINESGDWIQECVISIPLDEFMYEYLASDRYKDIACDYNDAEMLHYVRNTIDAD